MVSLAPGAAVSGPREARSASGALGGHERQHVVEGPRVEDVARLDHPRLAVPMPNLIWAASAPARWRSLSTVTVTPPAMASRTRSPSRSMWLGAPSTSSAVPVSTAAANTASKSSA